MHLSKRKPPDRLIYDLDLELLQIISRTKYRPVENKIQILLSTRAIESGKKNSVRNFKLFQYKYTTEYLLPQ